MYVDTKREGEAQQQQDIWSIKSFAAWLDQQPADATYDYCQPATCAATTYLWACGYPPGYGGHPSNNLSAEALHRLGWNTIVLASAGSDKGIGISTYGEAAQRAKDILAKAGS
jgi:hypothetical protein